MEVKFNAGDMCAIPDGCKATIKDGVIIFEKDFEDGDVLHSVHDGLMLIYKESSSSEHFSSHFNTIHVKDFDWNIHSFRYATEEEKQQLFAEMKEHGLRWNAEEKRVEKIRWRAPENHKYWYCSNNLEVVKITDCGYNCDYKMYNCGNYFRTEEQAKEAASRVKKTLQKYHDEIGE